MSDQDLPKPLEPHSGALPAVDPWAASDPLVIDNDGLPAAPGGQFAPLASAAEPATPGAGAVKPARSRLALLAALGLAGCLLIGLLVAGLPLLTSAEDDAGDRPESTAGQAGLAPSSVPAPVLQTPSSTAEPSSTPTEKKTTRPTPQATPTRPAKPTRSPSPKAADPPAHKGQLINGESGTCLTGTGADKPLFLQRCNGALYQQWTLRSDGTIRAGNLCMSLPGDATDIRTKVSMADCDGSPGQQFHLNNQDDLISWHANKCVDAFNRETADGTPLILWECQGQPNQSWYLK